MSVKITVEVTVYELNDKELMPGSEQWDNKLSILSHWSRPDLVVLAFHDQRLTVGISDMTSAVTAVTRGAKQ